MDGNGVPLGFAWVKMWACELQQPDLQTVSTAATAPETASSHDAAQVTSNTAPSNTAALPEVAALTKAEQKKIRDRAKEKKRKHTPIENKESIRWIESVREALKGINGSKREKRHPCQEAIPGELRPIACLVE